LQKETKMESKEQYKSILTEFIQMLMVVLGPHIILDKAKKVAGLTVDQSGQVVEMSGDGAMVLKDVISRYAQLSGPVTQMVLKTVLKKYPDMKA
jgi:hypothetical protein